MRIAGPISRLSRKFWTPPWIQLEHNERYLFASRYVKDRIVVDCACGEGLGTAILDAGGAQQVAAFDLSLSALLSARDLARSADLGFAITDAIRLPLREGTVDTYVCLETIEHISADLALLEEANRILRQDGLFICSTPNRTVTNPGTILGDSPWNRFHVREYDKFEFGELLSKFFHEVKLFGQNVTRSSEVRLLGWLAAHAPKHSVVRVRQTLKIPRVLLQRSKRFRVQPLSDEKAYEYLIALCSHPRQNNGTSTGTLADDIPPVHYQNLPPIGSVTL